MKFDILHELPGRMRVHCRSLRIDSDSRLELRRWVSRHPELLSAALSARTGNLLLIYSKDTPRHAIIAMLDDLRLLDDANIAGEDAGSEPLSLKQRIANAYLKEASTSVLKAVFPKMLLKTMSGWSIGCRLFDLAERLGNGQLGAFVYGVGKFACFALFAASLPSRFILIACFSAIEHILPWLKAVPETIGIGTAQVQFAAPQIAV